MGLESRGIFVGSRELGKIRALSNSRLLGQFINLHKFQTTIVSGPNASHIPV
jgi:hypothetical protein